MYKEDSSLEHSNRKSELIKQLTLKISEQELIIKKYEQDLYKLELEKLAKENSKLTDDEIKTMYKNTITKRNEVLEKALETITKDRQNSYGDPEDSFKDIADFWSIYLDANINSYDVAMMMILLKTARSKQNKKHVDNLIDIAGYSACAVECVSAT